jgi:hypothetical protein
MLVCSGARSDCSGEFVERGRDPEMTVSSVDAEFVVTATQVLHERVTRMITLAVGSDFSLRIGRSLALSRPWSHLKIPPSGGHLSTVDPER